MSVAAQPGNNLIRGTRPCSPGMLLPMAKKREDPDVLIPTVFISLSSGEMLQAGLSTNNSGKGVFSMRARSKVEQLA